MSDRTLAKAYKEGFNRERARIKEEEKRNKEEQARRRNPFTPLYLPPSFGEEDPQRDIFEPQTFEEYIGQSHVKELTQIMIEAANKEARPIPNVLISGPAGLGKTTLAKLMLKDKPHQFIDGNTLNSADINLSGYLLIDEIHNLRPEVSESLNPLIDKNILRVIGCTTNPGNLPSPFRSRFRQLSLVPYTLDDLTKIQYNVINRKETITAKHSLLTEISKRGRFTPRTTLQYLAFVMELMVVRDETTLTEQTLLDAFDKIGVDENGLLDIDHRYLAAIPNDRPVGLQYLEAVLQTDKETIENDIEPYLLQIKAIDRNSRGRFKIATLEQQLEDSLKFIQGEQIQ